MRDARTSSEHRALVLLLVLAFALRVIWWAGYVEVIENEGVEYARLAWNWFHGRGYVSIFGGTHTLFPPFYPLLIGLTAPLAGSEESSARLVSLLAGLAVVGAGYLTARRVFGDRVAVLAGSVLACHPILIALSVSTYSEGLYLGLGTLATLAGVEALSRGSWRAALLTGLLAGCAYLTRPEGIALALGFGAVILTSLLLRHSRPSRAAGYALLVVIAAGVVASPYVVHLSRIAGSFRLEGKSALNNRLARAVDQGLTMREAGRGLGPQAEPRGVWLFTDQHALLADSTASSKGMLRALTEAPIARVRSFIRALLSGGHLGSPLLPLLVLAGLLLTGWWKHRAPEGLALLILPGVSLLVMMGIRWNWPRYYFPLLGTGLIWAAAGAGRLGGMAARLTARLGGKPVHQDAAAWLVAAGLLLALVAQSARNLSHVTDISQTRLRDVRLAGELIRADARQWIPAVERPRIATFGLAVAHYARGEATYLPYADEARSLAYLRRLAPQYLFLRTSEFRFFPYARKWLERGPDDRCAELVNGPGGEAIPGVRIWRWRCGRSEPVP